MVPTVKVALESRYHLPFVEAGLRNFMKCILPVSVLNSVAGMRLGPTSSWFRS